jgi:hypothetical protein
MARSKSEIVKADKVRNRRAYLRRKLAARYPHLVPGETHQGSRTVSPYAPRRMTRLPPPTVGTLDGVRAPGTCGRPVVRNEIGGRWMTPPQHTRPLRTSLRFVVAIGLPWSLEPHGGGADACRASREARPVTLGYRSILRSQLAGDRRGAATDC